MAWCSMASHTLCLCSCDVLSRATDTRYEQMLHHVDKYQKAVQLQYAGLYETCMDFPQCSHIHRQKQRFAHLSHDSAAVLLSVQCAMHIGQCALLSQQRYCQR